MGGRETVLTLGKTKEVEMEKSSSRRVLGGLFLVLFFKVEPVQFGD